MKPTQFKLCVALAAAMIGSGVAFAQINGAPGPQDYGKFSYFITDLNIFNPDRVAHHFVLGTNRPPPRPKIPTIVPSIQLVGTMSYEKGWFAFFNANTDEYRKACYAGEKIAGYTITNILADWVQLRSGDTNEEIAMKIGDGFLQEGGKWTFVPAAKISSATMSSRSFNRSSRSNGDNPRSRNSRNQGFRNDNSASGNSTSESAAQTPPPSATEQNDALKRLMQQREKENQ